MSAREPAEFPRRIFLATVGLVPQIVTETLYALCETGDPPFEPTEIHIVTTAMGEERIRRMLLDPPLARLAGFASEFGRPGLAQALTPERIHVITDASGQPLDDISTEEGNAATADLIIQTMFELTSGPDTALHVSIAGGRKTMGFLIGQALSIFGRQQDRLSHVLVEPQTLEQHPEFFYPPKEPVLLQDRRNPDRPVSTEDARIVLADIPFVRMRDGLPKPLLEGAWSYSQTIARAQTSVAGPKLILDPETQLVSCHGIAFRLTPMQFAMYAVIAKRRIAAPESNGLVHWTEIGGDEFIKEFENLPDAKVGEIGALHKDFRNIGKAGYENDDDPRASKFQQAKTRLNARLRETLGPYSAPYELVSRRADNSQKLIGIDLPADAISFEPLDPDGGETGTE